MIYRILAAALLVALCSPREAWSQVAFVVSSCGGQSYTAGPSKPLMMDLTGNLCTAASGGGGGAVTQGTSPWVVSGNGTAGTAASGVLSVQGIASMTPLAVTLGAGAAIAGKVGIDQTTDGTTNAVHLIAGSAVIGSIAPQLASFTDKSGAITVGGTSQTLAAINAARKRILVTNPCTATSQNIATAESLFINFTSAASPTAGGSIELSPCGSYDSGSSVVTTELIAVNAATTAHKWTAKEQ